MVTVHVLQGVISHDYRTDHCNPISPGVCYEASDVILSVSLLFQQAHLWPLGKPQNPPAALLLSNRPSALPVKFHNYNDSVKRVAGRLRVPTMHSRDILLQDKGDHLGQVHSDQMVLEMIRCGRLVR